jgi:hypothetical protein
MIIIGDLGVVWKETFMMNECTIKAQLNSQMAFLVENEETHEEPQNS